MMDKIDHYAEFARPLYVGKDAGHDFRHIERIISRLDRLMDGLEPRPLPHKLSFLACFHGLGSKLSNDVTLRQRVVLFLRDLGWQDSDINASISSLNTHLSNPRLPEEMVVHDANYFEVTGPFGIAKAFTVGGARGQTYEQTIEFFQANLNGVTFQTPAGKQFFESRKAYVRDYLEKLKNDL